MTLEFWERNFSDVAKMFFVGLTRINSYFYLAYCHVSMLSITEKKIKKYIMSVFYEWECYLKTRYYFKNIKCKIFFINFVCFGIFFISYYLDTFLIHKVYDNKQRFRIKKELKHIVKEFFFLLSSCGVSIKQWVSSAHKSSNERTFPPLPV